MKYLAILTAVLTTFIVGTAAFAQSEGGLVSANGASLRVEPNARAKTSVKLYVGQMVMVDDFRDGWVHVKLQMKRGSDTIPFEGWLEKKQVRSLNRRGFSFEGNNVPVVPDRDPQAGAQDSWAGDLEWGQESSAGGNAGGNDGWSTNEGGWDEDGGLTDDTFETPTGEADSTTDEWGWTETPDEFDTPMGYEGNSSDDTFSDDNWDVEVTEDDTTDTRDDDITWDDSDF